MAGHRERMVVSAALLIRERGAHPTAIADVLAHSGAPRGSAYHYFPGGRTQLLCEAIDYAAEFIATRIEQAGSSVELLDAMFDGYRRQLEETDYRAGCPIVAVTVEADEADKGAAPLIDRAAAAFARWNGAIAGKLVLDGVVDGRAEDLAMFITSSIEGAIVIARASRTVAPLDLVHRQLRALVEAAMPEGNRHD